MVKIKKVLFLNSVFIIVCVFLLCNSLLYASSICFYSQKLRVPVDKKYIRQRYAIKTFFADPHYRIMDESRSQYTKAIYEPRELLLSSLDKLAKQMGDLNKLFAENSTILVVGFGENWQELEVLSDKFPQCAVVGVDWLDRNIKEAKKHVVKANVEFVQQDIRNMDLTSYPPVRLIYVSYLIDEKLYGSDMEALRQIVVKLSSALGEGGFIVSTPANYITSLEFERTGLDILLNEGAGLKTVLIAKKSISKALPLINSMKKINSAL
jgi:hypothetical protein